MNPVPVLMYHSIGPVPASSRRRGLFVSARTFERQMALLARRGLRGVTVSEALPYLRGEAEGRVCAITFDDGFADNADVALPILERHGHRATCYVVSERIGGTNDWSFDVLGAASPLMDESRVRRWIEAGMELGAHTRTHARLTALDASALWDEIAGSKRALEDRFGREVTQFCYPWGAHDDRVVEAVREAGFTAATTTVRGRARPPLDLLRVPRLHVLRHHGPVAFRLKLFTSYGDRP